MRRSQTAICSGAEHLETNFIARRKQVADRLPEFEALRDCGTRHQEPHPRASRSLSRGIRAERARLRAGMCILPPRPPMRARSSSTSAARRRQDRDQGQIDGRRGDRPQRFPRRNTRLPPVETDLGEYIIQLRHELPSHIIAPAVHLSKEQIEADFRRVHTRLAARPQPRGAGDAAERSARVLREKFLAADVGITGANFLIAETGTSIIVTNEGNGDLTQTLPKAHIVLASIEKLVPTLEDVAELLRVLARSATGQEMSVYTTLSTGPRRPAIRTDRANITSSCSTTAAPPCWAANSRTCFAAFAAAPA